MRGRFFLFNTASRMIDGRFAGISGPIVATQVQHGECSKLSFEGLSVSSTCPSDYSVAS